LGRVSSFLVPTTPSPIPLWISPVNSVFLEVAGTLSALLTPLSTHHFSLLFILCLGENHRSAFRHVHPPYRLPPRPFFFEDLLACVDGSFYLFFSSTLGGRFILKALFFSQGIAPPPNLKQIDVMPASVKPLLPLYRRDRMSSASTVSFLFFQKMCAGPEGFKSYPILFFFTRPPCDFPAVKVVRDFSASLRSETLGAQ